jgi:hypothetical protein
VNASPPERHVYQNGAKCLTELFFDTLQRADNGLDYWDGER